MTFLVLCKEVGLSINDLKMMTYGMALDYIDEYFEMRNPKKMKKAVRKASQADFDSF